MSICTLPWINFFKSITGKEKRYWEIPFLCFFFPNFYEGVSFKGISDPINTLTLPLKGNNLSVITEQTCVFGLGIIRKNKINIWHSHTAMNFVTKQTNKVKPFNIINILLVSYQKIITLNNKERKRQILSKRYTTQKKVFWRFFILKIFINIWWLQCIQHG